MSFCGGGIFWPRSNPIHARTQEQQKYAAADVLYLHKIKNKLDRILEREGRIKLVQSCFNFIEHRTNMDLLGWADQDIFKH